MKTKAWERANFYTNPEAVAARMRRRTPEQIEIDECRAELAMLREENAVLSCGGWGHFNLTIYSFGGSSGSGSITYQGNGVVGFSEATLAERIKDAQSRLSSLLERKALRQSLPFLSTLSEGKKARL